MASKFKKKIISMALAICMAASPIATLPINVFAGTDTIGGTSSPLNYAVLEAKIGESIDTKYTIDDSKKSFSFYDGGDNVLDGSNQIQKPGIVYAGNSDPNNADVAEKTYIIANIDGILHNGTDGYKDIDTAYGAGKKAFDAAKNPAVSSANDATNAAYNADTYNAANDAARATDRATDGYGASADEAYYAYYAARNTDKDYSTWAASYRTYAPGVVSEIIGAYNGKKSNEVNKAWVIAAYAAARAAQKMSDGNGLDLEAKLKIAHMAYRIAEAVWTQKSDENNRRACQARAEALKEVIDNCYENKVGDIEAQATQQAAQEPVEGEEEA